MWMMSWFVFTKLHNQSLTHNYQFKSKSLFPSEIFHSPVQIWPNGRWISIVKVRVNQYKCGWCHFPIVDELWNQYLPHNFILNFLCKFLPSGKQESTLKARLVGNKYKSGISHFSEAIKLCNQYLPHNGELKPKSYSFPPSICLFF